MLPFLLLACSGDPRTGDSAPAAPDSEGIAVRDDGWFRGDLHMHTDWSDGWDDLATVVALGEYLGSEAFVEAHADYAGNALDFLAITDHRTVDGQGDPAWASSELVLIGGEEFGSTGHAGLHGVHEFVDHDPDGDGTTVEDVEAAVAATHGQGATFSPNHPMLPDIAWPWDVRGHDAVEVWNAGWSLMSPPNTIENLETWEASHGSASPLYRRALASDASNSCDQALVWVEAQLARGLHPAVIGGSDRHAVLLPGFPTTWVRGEERTEAGMLDGIRARRTFISRTPASAQVLATVTSEAGTFEMGDEVPVGAGEEVLVEVRVARAEGARVRIIGGGAVESDEALDGALLGEVWAEETVGSGEQVVSVTVTVDPGDWFYPVVHEPLVPDGLDADLADRTRALAAEVAVTGAEDFVGLAQVLAPLVDSGALFDSSTCDPSLWDPELLQCLPVDVEGLGSFYVPDYLDRALNVLQEGGAVTDWSMGAVGSPTVFVGG